MRPSSSSSWTTRTAPATQVFVAGQVRCRAMDLRSRASLQTPNTGPPTRNEWLLFPLSTRYVHLQHPFSKATPCAPPLQPERRDERPVHGNSQRAMNRPFNTASPSPRFALQCATLYCGASRNYLRTPYSLHRHDATPPARNLRKKRPGSAPAASLTFGLSCTPHSHPQHILRAVHPPPCTGCGRPTGGFIRRYKCPLVATRPRPLATAPAPEIPGRCGHQRGPGRDARRVQRACHLRTGGTRPVPRQVPLPSGGTDACVRSRVSPLGHFKRLS